MNYLSRFAGASALAIASCCLVAPVSASADETPECNANENASGTLFDGL